MTARIAGSTLDHGLYPDIFDLIFQYASPAALHVFRATCRSLCERVDARLFKHVVMTGMSRPTLQAPHGRLPGLRWDDETATRRERALWTRRLGYTLVLDCHSKVDIVNDDPALATALSNLKVVYRFEPTAPALPAVKLVDYAFLTPMEGTHTHADSSISSPCDCASAFTFDIPLGTKTSVTNVLYDPLSLPIHSFLQLGRCPDSTHSVIIYTARSERTSGKASPTPSCGSDHLPRLGMLFHLVEELALRIGHAVTNSGGDSSGKVTLVGIDEIDHALLAMPDSASAADIQRSIVEAVQEECSVFFPQDIAQQVSNSISFVSRHDYARQHGWEAFVLASML